MNKKIFLTSLVLMLAITTKSQNWFSGSKRIKGNGNTKIITRSTSNYDAIAIGGSFDVVLIKGNEGEITIEAEENILPYIETEVSRNTLKVKFKDNTNINTTKRMTVTIPYKSLESVSLGGSGSISCKSLIKSNDFKVSIGGSGNIDLKLDSGSIKASIGGSGSIYLEGNTNEFDCSIAGSGNINAYNLETDELNANVAGSGNIKTTVSSKIDAKVVGSGSIYYKGKPSNIKSKSVGSGDVVDKN
ncbi:head GIN domain-containing protein [Polaribacter sp. Asnod1-A03]|uniref:head GIN domain-containing protein n=1 Tax=Polaribacter sp. Asnod1-A03 TaxID=3160581 RepID=UPI00386C254F